MKNLKVLPLIFLFLFMTTCATYQEGQESEPPPTRKFTAYSFIRESRDITLIVDVELAHQRKKEKYFPLSIKVANKRMYSLTLDRESFILVDEDGNTYNMPEVVELQQNYFQLAPDNKFKSQTGLLADQMLTGFTFYRRAMSNFFPQTQGAARVIDRVYIQRNGYMEDLIYFPMPPGGIEGRPFILRLDSPELKVPFEVTFIIQ